MKNGFTASKIFFCGVPGYMVSQYIDGKEVVNQFVAEDCYKDFCEMLGVIPIIID